MDTTYQLLTTTLIANELRAVTAVPPPNVAIWAFTSLNDMIFASQRENNERVSPEEWVKQGSSQMVEALAA